MKKFGVLILICLVAVCGCLQSHTKKCPECPKPNPWTECVNGIRYRTNFKCGSDTNYECVSYREYGRCCEENWTCSEWSKCKNGTQIRICTDLNQCNTTKRKEKRKCF